MCIFSVFIGQKCCVYTCIQVPPICASMRDTCMNPEVEFTVYRVVLRNFDHARNQVYNKSRIFFKKLQ